MTVTWTGVSGATSTSSVTTQIAETYQVTITNPVDRAVSASDILMESATLSTAEPDGSGRSAPSGSAFLTFAATSATNSDIADNPNQPPAFGEITALPASAIHYISASGRSYPAIRVNVNTPMMEFSSTDDGLVDATYIFTVPFGTQRGHFVISPFRTIGYEVNNTNNQGPYALTVSGPTKIPVSFPTPLQLASSGTATSGTQGSSSSSNSSPFTWIVGLALFGTTAFLILRWRKRALTPVAAGAVDVGPIVVPAAPSVQTSEPVVTSPDVPVVPARPAQLTPMRVGILGPLTYDPPIGTDKEAVRGIATFLSVYNDRALTRSELMASIYPTSSTMAEVTEGTFLNRISDTRAVLGNERFPEAKAGRYQLQSVTTDWDQFRALATSANELAGESRRAQITEAMSLVRGEPFTGEGGRNFLWVREKGLDYEITRAVIAVAHNGLGDFLKVDDLAGAEQILRAGLRLAPAAHVLWEDLTDVLLEHHDQSLMKRHFSEAMSFLPESDVEALRQRENG